MPRWYSARRNVHSRIDAQSLGHPPMKRCVALEVCFFLTVALALQVANGAEKCCRPLTMTVRYTEPPTDVTRRSDCDVIRALPVSNSLALTIRCPSGPVEELEGFIHYKELTTRDYGRTWTLQPTLSPIASPLATAWVDFAQAPSNREVLYRYVQELGLYLRSDDGGVTWSLPKYVIDRLSKEQFVAKFDRGTSFTEDFHLSAIDPKNPYKIYAGIVLEPWASMINMVSGTVPATPSVASRPLKLKGLYVSNDGGNSWTKFSEILKNSVPLGISVSNTDIIYGQSDRGVVKSTDGGRHWVPVGESTKLSEPVELPRTHAKIQLEIFQFAVSPTDPNVVFIVSNKGVYRTLDGGKTWCLLNLGFDEVGSARSLAINKAKPAEIFVGTTRGVFYSNDAGCHFQKIYPRQ